jgi:hypothetical protein
MKSSGLSSHEVTHSASIVADVCKLTIGVDALASLGDGIAAEDQQSTIDELPAFRSTQGRCVSDLLKLRAHIFVTGEPLSSYLEDRGGAALLVYQWKP